MPNAWQAFTRGGKESGKQSAPWVPSPAFLEGEPKAFSARISVTALAKVEETLLSLGLATGSLCTE